MELVQARRGKQRVRENAETAIVRRWADREGIIPPALRDLQ